MAATTAREVPIMRVDVARLSLLLSLAAARRWDVATSDRYICLISRMLGR